MKQVVRKTSAKVFSVEYEAGKLVFPRAWKVEGGTFPLIAPDVKCDDEKTGMINEILKRENMKLTEFLTDEHFFIAREREMKVIPGDFSISFAVDERNSGRKKAVVRFFMPKGAYATIITKALFEQ